MTAPDRMVEFWEQRYRAATIPWDRQAVSPALGGWLDNGLEPCRILVPGCGRGHEVMELTRRGFEVVAVDLSPTALAGLADVLGAESLDAELIPADLLAWTPDRRFDAVYEQTCLCALPPGLWGEYARRLADWLLPGGRLFALFMQTEQPGGPPYHCPLAGMRRLFPPALWQWPEAEPEVISHPAGLRELATVLVRR